MKFKKIEISAFRAYDLKEDSTFDFHIKDDIYADFISIYAPNGFGKTSFYDAVEWGFTNNINRFLRDYKLNLKFAKTEGQFNEDAETCFIRNRNSNKTTISSVVLHTTDEKLSVITKTLAKARKNQPDYKFDDKETIRKYFREVILSQENIDSFLRADHPHERYNTFIEYFGDAELDLYYRSLVSLLKTNKEDITKLKEDLNGLQLSLAFEGDHQVLKKTNDLIAILQGYGEKLNRINHDFNETEAITLDQFITERLNEIEFAAKDQQEQLLIVGDAISGNDAILGLKLYTKRKLQLKEINTQLIDAKSKLDLFVEIKKSTNKLESLESRAVTQDDQRKLLASIIDLYPIYEEVSKALTNSDIESNNLRKEIEKKEKDKNDKAGILAREKTKFEQAQNRITHLLVQQEKIPELALSITNRRIRIADLEVQKLSIGKSEISKNQDLISIRAELANLEESIDQITKETYPSLIPVHLTSFELSIKQLTAYQNEKIELQSKLAKLQFSIDKQNALRSDIQALLQKGLEIIQNRQNDTCPLCNYKYNDYMQLANIVASNSTFSDELQDYFNQSNQQNLRLNEITNFAYGERLKLLAQLQIRKKELEETIDKSITDLSALKLQAEHITFQITHEENSQRDVLAIFNNKSEQEFKELQARLIKEIEASTPALRQSVEKVEKDFNEIQQEISSLIEQDKTINENVKRLAENDNYKTILEYFSTSFPKTVPELTETQLKEMLSVVQNDLDLTRQDQSQTKTDITNFEQKVSETNEDEIRQKIKSLENEIDFHIQQFSQYELFILNNVGIETTIDNPSQLRLVLENQQKKIKTAIENFEKRKEQYSLLSKLKENLLPYLRFEVANDNNKKIKEEILFLEKTVTPKIEAEKQRVIDHLDLQINSFFYEEMINDLYRKIDPHPDATTIKFKCDFTDDKPQLNVFVSNAKKDVLQIPNLYFSTAQLNILSLSIFLAKALHAYDQEGNPLRCIFIDDPIQSMDSINILSTIDLLRSIVVNKGFQIILSTHDSNFHNLLMKKIPQEKFNAKYIELETFGKVKK